MAALGSLLLQLCDLQPYETYPSPQPILDDIASAITAHLFAQRGRRRSKARDRRPVPLLTALGTCQMLIDTHRLFAFTPARAGCATLGMASPWPSHRRSAVARRLAKVAYAERERTRSSGAPAELARKDTARRAAPAARTGDDDDGERRAPPAPKREAGDPAGFLVASDDLKELLAAEWLTELDRLRASAACLRARYVESTRTPDASALEAPPEPEPEPDAASSSLGPVSDASVEGVADLLAAWAAAGWPDVFDRAAAGEKLRAALEGASEASGARVCCRLLGERPETLARICGDALERAQDAEDAEDEDLGDWAEGADGEWTEDWEWEAWPAPEREGDPLSSRRPTATPRELGTFVDCALGGGAGDAAPGGGTVVVAGPRALARSASEPGLGAAGSFDDEVNLAHYNLSATAGKRIPDVVRSAASGKRLRRVSVRGCGLGDGALAALVATLAEVDDDHLESLDLRSNAGGPKLVAALCEALADVRALAVLSTLDASSTRLKGAAKDLLATVASLAVPGGDRPLSRLSLADNGMRDDAGPAVALVVRRDAVLHFDVGWNELTTLSGAPIVKALGLSHSVATLAVDEHAIPRRSRKSKSQPASAAVRMVQRRRPTQGVPQKQSDLQIPAELFHYKVKQGVATLIRRPAAVKPRTPPAMRGGASAFHV